MTELAALTWPDVPPNGAVLVVPVGSVEQHGPHLPLDTDTRVAAVVARLAVERLVAETDADDYAVVLGPALPYGASGEHEGFPGTVSIGTTALELVVVELVRSASRWASRIALINGHGGNLDALRAAVARLRSEGRDAVWFPCVFPGGDAHAGETETSVLIAADPGTVRADRLAPGETAPIGALIDRLRAEGVAAVAPNGVLGDPTTATAGNGAHLLEAAVGHLAIALRRWTVGADGRLQ
ncbi:mycofactocin biosynthesis peptidyl-dipeptidase MftE [Tsukamurella asaccharolytica]|uniref:Mycofactocin biosynthesis peptidyl-dipeptidase MftE n=1 Tax=Tsukamurella asaccharolytica TaxID=2592067 RepID=A0A5C5R7N0_9ACTN|nr:mycofactocin biosynthesis peptidyl-dipeptidase MftE [Tsukamurella asaccharolytica]TWS18444.1 mycofactocin biosynthesis peptidyl-dipeptidase MftE [Tsukamurella asaccharolytica]